jgi:methylthioribose-1-phosphate isomerase
MLEKTRQSTLTDVRTVWWEEENASATVCLLDQSLLPQQEVVLRLTHETEVAEAIQTLKVRGAPAIGVTAAFGVALALLQIARENDALTLAQAQEHLQSVSAMLCSTRPTAVNLSWAVTRIQQRVQEAPTVQELVAHVRDEALAIAAEDAAACRQMGLYGADLIAESAILLTHCNAGILATSGIGTALAPIYTAHNAGKHVHVFVDETRPVLQGARLTAWELQKAGIQLTLITDNMAGHFMRHGGIQAVFVGADRIAANGDVANKIGTYGLAVLAAAHDIPFYVVAPCSTVDLTLASGADIPIEQRNVEEVTTLRGMRVAPEGVHVANPAFDVTPHKYVTAIITERGVAWPRYSETLSTICTASETLSDVVEKGLF